MSAFIYLLLGLGGGEITVLSLILVPLLIWWIVRFRAKRADSFNPPDWVQSATLPANHSSPEERSETAPSPPATTTPPPPNDEPKAIHIFISYRRQDSSDVTGRLYDRLIHSFGKASVFKDVDSIPLGVDFRQHLADSVGQCDVLLAVIGRNWVGQGTDSQRIDDPRDYVRIEVEAALKRNIPVIPVLVQGAAVPGETDLPEALQSLAYRHGVAVRPDPDFDPDVARLIRGIEKHLKS